ncbi:MAG: Arabinose 5-phosphate isomerase KdsD [Alphaproteobacteria bacterium MarineAlpha9_Bin4]|nr:MAG: Arabinose 5-phosphate isomerase KdsD [Alphaproteobacteria bacterium MarineAlpha9_Bin4]|tara:strand:+ start:959 stop:1909 length:951 start_codon:yes stop_codon:yes gene_type:complete
MLLKYAKTIINEEAIALGRLAGTINSSFVKAVDTISSVKGNIIITGVGKSGFIAKKIASTMNSIGAPSSFMHPTEASHGDLGFISKKDVLIILSKSGKSKELIDLTNYAIHKKIPIIFISCNLNCKLARNSSCNLILPILDEAGDNKLAPTTSTTMMLALGDALALCISKKKNFSVKDFGKLHPGGNIGAKFIKINEVMHKFPKIPLSDKSTNMKNIILKMSQKGFGCVGIINHNKNLVGIITDGDLRRNMRNKILEKKAEDVMVKNPKTILKSKYLKEALEVFNKEKITVLFVLEKSSSRKPIGIIHLHDCLSIN